MEPRGEGAGSATHALHPPHETTGSEKEAGNTPRTNHQQSLLSHRNTHNTHTATHTTHTRHTHTHTHDTHNTQHTATHTQHTATHTHTTHCNTQHTTQHTLIQRLLGALDPSDRAAALLFHEASASVVNISTTAEAGALFPLSLMRVPAGAGSGFIWDEAGHVVSGRAGFGGFGPYAPFDFAFACWHLSSCRQVCTPRARSKGQVFCARG